MGQSEVVLNKEADISVRVTFTHQIY